MRMMTLARRGAVKLHRSLDVPAALTRVPTTSIPFAFYSVYRRRNAATLKPLLDEAHGTVALWALDEPAPELADVTLGSGPGTKFDLLNRMIEAAPPAGRWAVFSDDDYLLERGSLTQFVSLAEAGGFSLAQPSHVPDSHWSHHVTVTQPRSTARRTQFVEIGPVFAVNPKAGVLPFPHDAGMGWGLDFQWSRTPGLILGVIDHVRIRHLEPVGQAYDLAAEQASQTVTEDEQMVRDAERVGKPWRPWQASAPWQV